MEACAIANRTIRWSCARRHSRALSSTSSRKRAELVRQASPDRDDIKRLLSKIDAARDGETLLSNIMAALDKHHEAEDARKKLREVFEAERSACTALGRRASAQPALRLCSANASK